MDFKTHVFDGIPTFTHQGSILTITRRTSEDVGAWIGTYPKKVEEGDRLIVRGSWDCGSVQLLLVSELTKTVAFSIGRGGQTVIAPRAGRVELYCQSSRTKDKSTFVGMGIDSGESMFVPEQTTLFWESPVGAGVCSVSTNFDYKSLSIYPDGNEGYQTTYTCPDGSVVTCEAKTRLGEYNE